MTACFVACFNIGRSVANDKGARTINMPFFGELKNHACCRLPAVAWTAQRSYYRFWMMRAKGDISDGSAGLCSITTEFVIESMHVGFAKQFAANPALIRNDEKQ